MGDAVGRIFLSYRREDTRHMAGRLADRLKARVGSAQVFMDVDAIEPGADFTQAIASEVGSCDVLIALIGPHWLAVDERLGRPRLHEDDDFVALEIRAALKRGVRVIPALVDEARMPAAGDLPDGLRALASRNAVRLDHETFTSDVGRLLSAVERILSTALAERTARDHQHPPGGGSRSPDPAPGPRTYGPNPPPVHGTPDRRPSPGHTDEPRAWLPVAGVPLHPGFAGAPGTGREQHPVGTPTQAPAVSAARVAWRIILWWVTYFMSMFVASGIFLTLAGRTGTNIAGGIGVSVFLCGVLGGIVFLLRREITKQRLMLGVSGPKGVSQLSGNALSTRHVRVVAVICAVVAVALGLAVSFTPPVP